MRLLSFQPNTRLFLTLLLTWPAMMFPLLAEAEPTPAVLDLSIYRGKVVYLDFWASWCGPCRESFPWMNHLQQRYQDQGLEVVAVNVDTERGAAQAFLHDYPARFGLIFDPQGDIAESYDLQGMPSSFLIGRDGVLAYKHLGFRKDDPAALEARIKQLLAQPAE